jgi:UDP-N-acetyl-alpha-D-muramoyl-L-alanyl-L-glutamate epimerase
MPHEEFVFEGYRYDGAASALSLFYGFRNGPRFEERLSFGFPSRELSSADREILDRLLRLILLFAGVSYYKAFIPRTLRCAAFPLDRDTADLLHSFYEHGLGEFAFRNGVSLKEHLTIRTQPGPALTAVETALPRWSCVPVGGGKDSIVTLECLRRSGEPLVLFALGDAEPIRATIAVAKLPFLRVQRQLDPLLFALNKAGALNGHVPITGILSVIALAAAVLHGCDAVVMSNEHSASAPNLIEDGVAVNHQYSKSLGFEADLSTYLTRHISPNLAYFSLLRPLSEVEIARRFSHYPAYFGAFRSCNTAFRQAVAARGRHWCGECPKCRFVFLVLAPFVAKAELVAIFGANLLDDARQVDGFGELCGFARHKPFECVGEVTESAAAMAHLANDPQWRCDAVVKRLSFPALRQADPAAWRRLFETRHPHRLPERYLAMLDACG